MDRQHVAGGDVVDVAAADTTPASLVLDCRGDLGPVVGIVAAGRALAWHALLLSVLLGRYGRNGFVDFFVEALCRFDQSLRRLQSPAHQGVAQPEGEGLAIVC